MGQREHGRRLDDRRISNPYLRAAVCRGNAPRPRHDGAGIPAGRNQRLGHRKNRDFCRPNSSRFSGAGYFSTRPTTSDNRYAAKILLRPDRTVVLRIIKAVGGVETTLASGTVAGLTYSPDAIINVRFSADDASPTSLRARAWAASAAEPTTWQLVASNSDPALQGDGTVAVTASLPAAATNSPVTVHFENLLATCDNCVIPA